MKATFTTILLAGDREGDVLAAQSPGKRKALLHLGGRPMITYVLETLLAAKHVGNIVVVANRVREIGVSDRFVQFTDEGRCGVYFLEFGAAPRASATSSRA